LTGVCLPTRMHQLATAIATCNKVGVRGDEIC
jgi:hypothetical protein